MKQSQSVILHNTKSTLYAQSENNMSHNMTKPTKWQMCSPKSQISLGICPVWSKSSLCAQWVVKDLMFLHADSEDSDQTWWMPRLIWVFAGCTGHFVGVVVLQLNYCLTTSIGQGHAKTCLMPYENNKHADQPAHPHSLISTLVVRCLDSMICIHAISKVSRF